MDALPLSYRRLTWELRPLNLGIKYAIIFTPRRSFLRNRKSVYIYSYDNSLLPNQLKKAFSLNNQPDFLFTIQGTINDTRTAAHEFISCPFVKQTLANFQKEGWGWGMTSHPRRLTSRTLKKCVAVEQTTSHLDDSHSTKRRGKDLYPNVSMVGTPRNTHTKSLPQP